MSFCLKSKRSQIAPKCSMAVRYHRAAVFNFLSYWFCVIIRLKLVSVVQILKLCFTGPNRTRKYIIFWDGFACIVFVVFCFHSLIAAESIPRGGYNFICTIFGIFSLWQLLRFQCLFLLHLRGKKKKQKNKLRCITGVNN